VEISLQPWHAFKPDGVILFSDILTPLPGMGIPFDMAPGPIIMDPIRTMAVSPFVKHLPALTAEPDPKARTPGTQGTVAATSSAQPSAPAPFPSSRPQSLLLLSARSKWTRPFSWLETAT
jgi:uroporphyrinogen-III decarboxylase